MINQFIDWYSYADTITILDNHSSDRTAKIALSRGCKVVPYGTNEQDNLLMAKVKETCWQGSTADWVIVCDIDEFVYHPVLREVLSNTPASVIKCVGYHMVSEDLALNKDVKYGTRAPVYDKCLIFKPSRILKMNWTLGCHSCEPTGDVCYLEGVVNLFHFHYIGRAQVHSRYNQYLQRMSKSDLENGWGIHYTLPHEEIDRAFDECLKNKELLW
jgi:glycosyltransferase involved in cell wall biosynthesis